MGLFIGFIISLQSRNNRMFLLEGARDLDCNWNPVQNLSCSDLTLINIILFLAVGFMLGGIIHKKSKNHNLTKI